MPRQKSTSKKFTRSLEKKRLVHLRQPATKEQRAELRTRGYIVNHKGIILDRPRDKDRKQIPGAKMSIQTGGVIKWTVGQRRDFILGLTTAERKEFEKDPEKLIDRKLKALRESHPKTFKGLKQKPRVKLQWGAYASRMEFSPHEFARKYPLWAKWLKAHGRKFPESVGRVKTAQAKDRLVGLHIVIHVPRRKKK
jgi:hypothetical protein